MFETCFIVRRIKMFHDQVFQQEIMGRNVSVLTYNSINSIYYNEHIKKLT